MKMNKVIFAALVTALAVSVPLVKAWDCNVPPLYCACPTSISVPAVIVPGSCYIEDGGAYISCMNLYVTVQNIMSLMGSEAQGNFSIWSDLLQGKKPRNAQGQYYTSTPNNAGSYLFAELGQTGNTASEATIASDTSQAANMLTMGLFGAIEGSSTAASATTTGCNYADVPYVHLSNLHMAVIPVQGYPKTDATALALVKTIVSQTSAQDLQNFFVNNDNNLTLGVISLAGLLPGPDGTLKTGGQTAAFLQKVHDAVTDPSCNASSCPQFYALLDKLAADETLMVYVEATNTASDVQMVKSVLAQSSKPDAQAQDLDSSSATYGQSAFQIALANCSPSDSTQPCYQIALALSCAPQSANLNCPYATSSGLAVPTCSSACAQLTKGAIAATQATTSAQNLVNNISTVVYNPNSDSLSLLQALLGSTPLSSIKLPDILPNGQILSDHKNPKDAAWSVYLNLKSQLINDLNNTQNPVGQQTLANEANTLVAAANVYHWLCIQYAAQNGLQACDISAADAAITATNNLVNKVNNATGQASAVPATLPVTSLSVASVAGPVTSLAFAPTTCPKGEGITKNGTCGKCPARQGVMKNGKCGKCPKGQGIEKNGTCGKCKKINTKSGKCG